MRKGTRHSGRQRRRRGRRRDITTVTGFLFVKAEREEEGGIVLQISYDGFLGLYGYNLEKLTEAFARSSDPISTDDD